jgi:hypothetical protein
MIDDTISAYADQLAAGGLSPEEEQGIEDSMEDAQDYRSALTADHQNISALAMEASVAQLESELGSTTTPVSRIQVLEPGDDTTDLSGFATDAEVINGAAPSLAAAAVPDNPTCDEAGDADDNPTRPEFFAPTRFSVLETKLYGSASGSDPHRKLTRMHFQWLTPESLSWYCGDGDGKRGFEPEVKPQSGGVRWSTNWGEGDDDRDSISNLPSAYKDDLACGNENNCSSPNIFAPSTYPDFAMGTAHGRRLKYRFGYYQVLITNSGDGDTGTAIYRAQANVRATNAIEAGYCRARKLAAGGVGPLGWFRNFDKYCMFGTDTSCVAHHAIASGRHATGRIDWRDDPPACSIE